MLDPVGRDRDNSHEKTDGSHRGTGSIGKNAQRCCRSRQHQYICKYAYDAQSDALTVDPGV